VATSFNQAAVRRRVYYGVASGTATEPSYAHAQNLANFGVQSHFEQSIVRV